MIYYLPTTPQMVCYDEIAAKTSPLMTFWPLLSTYSMTECYNCTSDYFTNTLRTEPSLMRMMFNPRWEDDRGWPEAL